MTRFENTKSRLILAFMAVFVASPVYGQGLESLGDPIQQSFVRPTRSKYVIEGEPIVYFYGYAQIKIIQVTSPTSAISTIGLLGAAAILFGLSKWLDSTFLSLFAAAFFVIGLLQAFVYIPAAIMDFAGAKSKTNDESDE